MTTLTLRYDLRAPSFSTATHADLYAAFLEQCEWGDRIGFDAVTISEHHGIDDGFISSPLLVAAAVAGRTRRISINIAALLVPLHDPLRLSEDIAALHLLSGGRISIVAGLGYRPEEFEMFGVDRSARAALLEDAIVTMRRAWAGERVAGAGGVPTIVTPQPASQPIIMIGGSAPASAKRAARLGVPFMPPIADSELVNIYEREAERLGFKHPFSVLPGKHGFVHVSEDPERDWARILPHARYEAQTYKSWQVDGQRSGVATDAVTAAELEASGVYRVVTPDDCVTLAQEGSLVFHPLMGGLAPEIGWESLELFASKVLPRLRPT